MTAVALFGFSVSKTFWMLCLWSILNNFVALHYASRHMSWLHCFWGIGASVGPYIMSYCLTVKNSWESGYMTVGAFQIVLTVILFFSLPVWNKQAKIKKESQTEEPKHLKIHEALKIKGVKQVLIAFFSYCALETTAGLYLVLHQGIEAKVAARWASLFYLGITFGRFLNGFVTDKLGNRNMIRIGLGIITIPVQILSILASYMRHQRILERRILRLLSEFRWQVLIPVYLVCWQNFS